jgi:hypothetical protein
VGGVLSIRFNAASLRRTVSFSLYWSSAVSGMAHQTLKQRRAAQMRKMTPHLARVGAVASLFAQIELNLDMIIWTLLSVEQQLGACVTSQVISVSGKMRAVKALVQLINIRTDNPLMAVINKLTNDLEAVKIKRDRAVHDTWMASLTTRRVFQMRAALKGKELLFGQQKVPVAELERTIAQSRALLSRVYDLEQRIRLELGPWIKTPAQGRFSRIGSSRTLPPRHRTTRKKPSTRRPASL